MDKQVAAAAAAAAAAAVAAAPLRTWLRTKLCHHTVKEARARLSGPPLSATATLSLGPRPQLRREATNLPTVLLPDMLGIRWHAEH